MLRIGTQTLELEKDGLFGRRETLNDCTHVSRSHVQWESVTPSAARGIVLHENGIALRRHHCIKTEVVCLCILFSRAAYIITRESFLKSLTKAALLGTCASLVAYGVGYLASKKKDYIKSKTPCQKCIVAANLVAANLVVASLLISTPKVVNQVASLLDYQNVVTVFVV